MTLSIERINGLENGALRQKAPLLNHKAPFLNQNAPQNVQKDMAKGDEINFGQGKIFKTNKFDKKFVKRAFESLLKGLSWATMGLGGLYCCFISQMQKDLATATFANALKGLFSNFLVFCSSYFIVSDSSKKVPDRVFKDDDKGSDTVKIPECILKPFDMAKKTGIDLKKHKECKEDFSYEDAIKLFDTPLFLPESEDVCYKTTLENLVQKGIDKDQLEALAHIESYCNSIRSLPEGERKHYDDVVRQYVNFYNPDKKIDLDLFIEAADLKAKNKLLFFGLVENRFGKEFFDNVYYQNEKFFRANKFDLMKNFKKIKSEEPQEYQKIKDAISKIESEILMSGEEDFWNFYDGLDIERKDLIKHYVYLRFNALNKFNK